MKIIMTSLSLILPVSSFASFSQLTNDKFGVTSASSAVAGQITLLGGLMVSISGVWLAYKWVRRAISR